MLAVVHCALLVAVTALPQGFLNDDYRRDYLHPGFDGVDPYNHEFDYRNFRGYPVHIGNGRFYFLGLYQGGWSHMCRSTSKYHFSLKRIYQF